MKRLYILAGANGSGKSTFSKVLLPTEDLVYVNPDDIAKTLNPEDVRRRYVRSKENFLNVYANLPNHWMLYYNGGTDFILVAHGNGAINVVAQERYDAFLEGVCRK